MNKMKKAAFALCTGLALLGMSGCASTQIAEMAGAQPAPAPAAGVKVMRPLQSYGSMGGYRYRRFAVVAAAS